MHIFHVLGLYYIIGSTLNLIVSYLKYLMIPSEHLINGLTYILSGAPNVPGLVPKRTTDIHTESCSSPSPMPEQVLALICVTHDPVLFPPGPTGIAKVAKQNDSSVQSHT